MRTIDMDYDYKNKVLKNKLGITNKYILQEVEKEIIKETVQEIFEINDFLYTEQYLKKIHKQIFNSIYEFAGKYRKVETAKEEPFLLGNQIVFTQHYDISNELGTLFSSFPLNKYSSLDEKLEAIVKIIINLWKIHPFRTGNTITITVFICKYVEKILGYNIYNDIINDFQQFYVLLCIALIEDKKFVITDDAGTILNKKEQLFLFLKQIVVKYEENIHIYE